MADSSNPIRHDRSEINSSCAGITKQDVNQKRISLYFTGIYDKNENFEKLQGGKLVGIHPF